MDVIEHERLTNCTLTQMQFKKDNAFIAVLHFTDTVESSMMNITYALK